MKLNRQRRRDMISGASANYLILFYIWVIIDSRLCISCVSVKFSSVIHLTVDNYYLRGFSFISISV